MIRALSLLVGVALVLLVVSFVGACAGDGPTPCGYVGPFDPVIPAAQRETTDWYTPLDDLSGCTTDLATGVCVPSAENGCAAMASDPACERCAKASCCSEALACYGAGPACGCLVQARTDGADPSCSPDTRAEAAYKDEVDCLAQHCAACTAFAGGT